MKTCDDFTKDFSNQLRTLRMQKNISAREMSLSLGQNVNYINLIENGKRFPSLKGIYAICNFFDVSVTDFFEFTKDDVKANDYHTELQRVVDSLTEGQSEAVVNMVREFV